MNLLRKGFVQAAKIAEEQELPYDVLVVAVQLPNGNIETIENRGVGIKPKIAYYMRNYDDNFCLRHNPNIKIIGYMLV